MTLIFESIRSFPSTHANLRRALLNTCAHRMPIDSDRRLPYDGTPDSCPQELLRLVITTCWPRVQIPTRRYELTALLGTQRDALAAQGSGGDELAARTIALLGECLAMLDQLGPVAEAASTSP